MKFALDVEKHTHALFAGEPTGSKPNAYGDARKIVLPETGLTVRMSTLYWQSHPRDQRLWIEPHFPIEVTAGDDDSIRFQIGLAQGVLRFRGLVLGDTVAGDAHLGSARLGFHFR